MPCAFCGLEGHNRRTCEQWRNISNNATTVTTHETINHIHIYNTPTTPLPTTPPTTPPTLLRRRIRDTTTPTNIINYFVDRTPMTIDELTTYSPEKPSLVLQVDKPIQTDDCPICMESLYNTNKFITRCGHQFCGDCMITHIRHHNNCPCCRGTLA